MKRRARLFVGMLLAAGLWAWPALGIAGAPVANFQSDPHRGEVPLAVHFASTSSGGEPPLAFHWDFGDGGTSAEEHPTHVYQTPGDVEVTLTVTDRIGQTSTKTDHITVDGPTLVAALLPVSRSVVVNSPATAFLTVINAGAVTATGVTIELDPTTGPGGAALPAALTFQPTDPATNLLVGAPGDPLNIPPGQSQSYMIAVTPSAPLGPTDVRLDIAGSNSTRAARSVSGLNTLLLSASPAATPDIIAVARTIDPGGVLALSGPPWTGAFSVATANVGLAGGSISVSADTGTAGLPVGFLICRTDPATAQCVSATAPTVETWMDAGATATYSVFVAASAPVAFDPEAHRVFVRFTDAGAMRGATSVAVKTR